MKKIILLLILLSVLFIAGCGSIAPPNNVASYVETINESPSCTNETLGRTYYDTTTQLVYYCNSTHWK